MLVSPIRFLVLTCVAVPMLGLGCRDSEKCARASHAASGAWQNVSATAAKNKLVPETGLDEIPPERRGDHVAAWATIEKQAEMIGSSFAYQKITWNTADPARAKANAAFEGYFAKATFKSFQSLLGDANAQYAAAASACRD